jgi:hypothetical protein
MRDYFDELLEREVDAGITTAEDAARIRKLYPNYVPTYKPSEFDQMLKRQTKDEIDVGRGLKAATGGEHDLVPLFNQMQVKTNVVLKRTELNKTLNLLCMASGTTKKELEDISPFFANKQDEDKLLDLLDSQVFTKEREGKHIATMYFDGAPIDISIDKEVYDAIRRWSGEDRKWLALCGFFDNKATNFVNTQFKKWITDYNIFFGIKNFKRDLATALFYTKDIKGYVNNLPKAMAACWLPDKMLTKEMKVYKEAFKTYKENGGVISQFIARDSATTTFFDSTRKFNILKWVEDFNSSLETVPRMAEFISTMDSKALKAAGKTIIYVNCSGSAIALQPETETCDAIVQAWYAGQEGGTAIADVLFGSYNPSGKLPVTFYRSSEQLPDYEDYSMKGRTYRYFSDPLFAFGYGLSYTQFEIGEGKLEKGTTKMDYKLTVPVSNTGKRDGTEIVQVYIRDLSDTEGPLLSLRGFQRVDVKAGQNANAQIQLNERSFEFFDTATNTMRTKAGRYEILYGNSSQKKDLKRIEIEIQ